MGIVQWAILDHKYAGYISPQQPEVCICLFFKQKTIHTYTHMLMQACIRGIGPRFFYSTIVL